MKRFTILFLMFYITNLAIAQTNKFTTSIGMSYNVSDFNWSIAGNSTGQSPNILSELDFKAITSLGCFINGTYKPIKNLEIVAYYQQATVISGKGSDIDYKEDNRTNPTYDLSFSSNKGKLNVFKGGIKTPLLQRDRATLATAIYYRETAQDFYILSNEMPDLKSTYLALMKGVGLSIEVEYKINKNMYTLLSFDCYYIHYKAEANWNLLNIFMHPLSFSQASKGTSTDVDLKFGYKINSILALTFGGTFGSVKVYKGIDTSYLITNTQVSTQFNGAKNNRYGSMIGLVITL